jgi:hypothetical protein
MILPTDSGIKALLQGGLFILFTSTGVIRDYDGALFEIFGPLRCLHIDGLEPTQQHMNYISGDDFVPIHLASEGKNCT